MENKKQHKEIDNNDEVEGKQHRPYLSDGISDLSSVKSRRRTRDGSHHP